MRNPAAYVLGIIALLVLNVAWIWGGAAVARNLGFTGKWAVYKGQMIIIVPLMIAIWVFVIWSGIV
jgi:hypothetical protein